MTKFPYGTQERDKRGKDREIERRGCGDIEREIEQ